MFFHNPGSVRCVKNIGDLGESPIVTTVVPNETTQFRSRTGALVSNSGPQIIYSVGLILSRNADLTLETEEYFQILGETSGDYQCEISGLSPNTTYYIRAYALTIKGVYYGDVESFTTIPTLACNGNESVLYHGYTYRTVQIGDQCWLAENLRYLPSVTSDQDVIYDTAAFFVYGYSGYDVSEAELLDSYLDYGVLYNWNAAVQGSDSSYLNPSGIQGICPNGWHIPSGPEWSEFENCMKPSENTTTHIWYISDYSGSILSTDSNMWIDSTLVQNQFFSTSNFNALPGGRRKTGCSGIGSDGINSSAYWWSTSYMYSCCIEMRYIVFDRTQIYRTSTSKEAGHSVRCIKD